MSRLVRLLLLVAATVASAGASSVAYAQGAPATPADAPATPADAPATPAVLDDAPGDPGALPPVVRVDFRGNRKVESDAMRATLITQPRAPLDPERLREDVRALWRMGYFEDVRVEATESAGGVVLTFVVVEKPSVRKILVSGSRAVGLDKINEVIDLRRDAVLDLTKIKRNVEKIQELYVSKGHYLASVTHEVRPVEGAEADGDAEVDVWFFVDERQKVEIRRVSFLGNRSITDEELRSVMATQEGSFFSFLTDAGTYQEEAFERDLALLQATYYDRGYINVKVGTPRITLSADRRHLYLAVPIEEGPIFRIGKVDFKGDLFGPRADYFARLTVKQGDVFNRTRLGQDIVRLNDLYKDRGYAYVNVTPLTDIDADKRTISLVFEVDQGRKVYFERINIRGNSRTRDKVIRREMKISEGELFSQGGLDVSRRRVEALGFFEKVDVSTRRGSSDEFIEVNVEVSERATGTFQIGAGFSSVENFIAQAQVSQNNLFGRGQTLSLQAQLSGLRQLFAVRFVEPYFFDTRWTFAFDIFNSTRVFTTFARNSVGGDLSWGYPLSYEARAFLTYKLEQVDVSTSGRGLVSFGAVSQQVAPASVANLFKGGLTSSLRGSVTFDSRNNRLFPTRGFYNSAFLEVADEVTGSQNVFARYGGFARYYRPIIGPFVLKLNAEIGAVTSRSPDGVPITERYFVGGINDVRGFRPRTLGPEIVIQAPGEPNALAPLPLGGNLQLIWNSEIEFPLFEKIGISGVVFFDAGNAYNLEDKWCSREGGGGVAVSPKVDPCFELQHSLTEGIRTSVGFGFRWFSPIGPLRFEWGIPLDRQADEEPLVFEFTIGNFF